eukprot:6739453-Prymnesium_polylepis.1
MASLRVCHVPTAAPAHTSYVRVARPRSPLSHRTRGRGDAIPDHSAQRAARPPASVGAPSPMRPIC